MRQFLSNEGVPDSELPPFERFQRFAGMIAKVSKTEANEVGETQDDKRHGPMTVALSRARVRRTKRTG